VMRGNAGTLHALRDVWELCDEAQCKQEGVCTSSSALPHPSREASAAFARALHTSETHTCAHSHSLAAYVRASTQECTTQLINDGGKDPSQPLRSHAAYKTKADRNCNVEMRLCLEQADSGLQVRGVCFVVTGLLKNKTFTWRVAHRAIWHSLAMARATGSQRCPSSWRRRRSRSWRRRQSTMPLWMGCSKTSRRATECRSR
jgi:hypothetical protein